MKQKQGWEKASSLNLDLREVEIWLEVGKGKRKQLPDEFPKM